MNVCIYDHRNGAIVVPSDMTADIKAALASVNPPLTKNSVTSIKTQVKELLEKVGWSGEYRLDPGSQISISAYQKRIGMCFQTGNAGRVYADLLKLQALYVKGNIIAGIMLMPQQHAAKALGSNMANYERLVNELPIFSQVITMPLLVIGFDRTEE